jgi:hypothetical protein
MQIRNRSLALLSLLLIAIAAGCSLIRSLQVESVAKSVEPPSNIALYLSVSDDRQPVSGLEAQNFRIYEDNQLVPPEQSRQTLLERDAVALHKTLLLIDMSTARDPATRRSIARGAAGFVARVRANQGVTVMAFDGRAELQPMGEFGKGGQGPDEIVELTNFQIADPSRNLHGGIIKALSELDARLMTEKKPVRVGSLVLMTTGADLAGRWTYEGLRGVLDKSSHRVFAIGVGAKEKGFSLDDLGRAGTLRAPSLTSVGITFEEMATLVDAAYSSFYLLSYCSPGRDGHRQVKIEVVHHDSEGNERKGVLYEEFDAVGFGGNCDPSAIPRFGAAGAIETAPAAGVDAGIDRAPAPVAGDAGALPDAG